MIDPRLTRQSDSATQGLGSIAVGKDKRSKRDFDDPLGLNFLRRFAYVVGGTLAVLLGVGVVVGTVAAAGPAVGVLLGGAMLVGGCVLVAVGLLRRSF